MAEGKGPPDDKEYDDFVDEARTVADDAVAAMKRSWPRVMREQADERARALAGEGVKPPK